MKILPTVLTVGRNLLVKATIFWNKQPDYKQVLAKADASAYVCAGFDRDYSLILILAKKLISRDLF